MTVSPVRCALCDQIAGDRGGDLLHAHLGGAYRRRVALENDNAVVIPSLGPLTFGHVLVCPTRHVRSVAECDPQEFAALHRLADEATVSLDRLTGQPVHVFEHGNATGGQRIACTVEHAHLHLVPAKVDVTETVERLGGWECVGAFESPSAISRGREYLLYRPAGSEECWVRVTPDGEQVPSQLLRRLFATALGNPGGWNWREHPDALRAHEAYLALLNPDRTVIAV